ncbi:unnamed protein product, partial [Allacma fusca]
MSDEVLDAIVDLTNQKAVAITETWNVNPPNRERRWEPVDKTELTAFI